MYTMYSVATTYSAIIYRGAYTNAVDIAHMLTRVKSRGARQCASFHNYF